MLIKETSCYRISQDVITRDIEGELVIVPISSGIGRLDSPMYSLNKTGAALWNRLDGKTTLKIIVKNLALDFRTPLEVVHEDVMEIMYEFKRLGLIVEI